MKSRNAVIDSRSVVGKVPTSSGSIDGRRPANRLTTIILVLFAGVCFGTVAAHAQDATWLATPGSSVWNTAANWTPGTVPTGTATFGGSSVTTVTFSAATSVGGILFNVAAPAYAFNLTIENLTITGTGIGNSSSNSPTFSTTGATITFANASTAANATLITNNGGAGGFTEFVDTSTAADATITNNGGETDFNNTSTAANATITNSSDGETDFFNTSTAAHATIVNNIDGGFTGFLNTSTAANAIITNNGGETAFFNTSTAGNAIITTNSGGETQFNDTSTAGNATVTTNAGGLTDFNGSSTGGEARFITNAGGVFDISGLTSGGMIAGSIEGAGTYSLGSKALTVGGNNLSTEVSGVIADGGQDGGTGGALIKVGTGTLTLSGANTYTGGTTINGGTLQIGNGGITGSVIGNILDNAALVFDHSDAVIFSGIISGTGSLTQIGASPLILTGTNTYTGGTTISTGTGLQIGNAAPSGSIIGNVIDDGFLTFDRPDDITFAGNVSGTGILRQEGAGTLTLTGLNSQTGGTAMLGGTLSVDKESELGAIGSGLILQGGELLTTTNGFQTARAVDVGQGKGNNTLAAATGTTATYTGVFSDVGTLTVGDGVNDGTVMLASGANTYTGGTIVLGGATLSVDTDAELGDPSGGIRLAGGELLTTQNGFSSARAVSLTSSGSANTLAALTGTRATYTGVFSGDGALAVGDGTHAGTVVLAGANTYSGGTVINLGTLLVDNAQALGIGDVTVNGGVLGADPQPINVKGNYTQNAGGTLQLQVAGANAGQYDTLNVGGNAALGGTLQLISLGFKPVAGNLLTLVTTGGAVSSRFAQFVNPFATGPGFTTVDLIYGRNVVLLEFLNVSPPVPPVVVTTDFSSFAFTPNQSAAANLLDAVQLDPRAANLISFLNTEPFSNLPNDLQKISPDGLTSFYETSFSNANIQKLNLESRLDDLHNGSNGFSSNMKVNGATLNFEDRADADGKSSKAVVEPVLQPGPENRWGVWVTGFGDFVNVDGDGNAQGYNFTTGGVSLGLDYRITDQLAIGVMGEYSHTWTDLNPGGHIDVDSGRGGVYATWFSHGIYINGAIYGGHNNYDSGRAGLGGLANGSTEGSEWSTFIGGGYDFHIAQLTVGPIASLQYTDVGIDSFDEKGSLAPLNIHSGSAESLRSDVGFRAFYQWQIGKLVVEPSLKAAWEHEYKYSALPITAGFAGIPGPSATFFGPSEGHDSAVVSAGVSVQVTPAITTYVNYDGQLGRGNYSSNAVTGGVRISF